jgi:hypothetical protein
MSTAAIPVHIALVDTTDTVRPADLARVAGALNEQVQADFAPIWKVSATVGAYPAAPPGTWRISLLPSIRDAGGFHLDKNNQPYAEVALTEDPWSVAASHELLEMLADPWGSRLHTAAALPNWQGSRSRLRYLVEVCDPCERTTYTVGGVEVSDFLLPAFYRSSSLATAYSRTGAITEPLQILEGGYISFIDPESQEWWQRFVVNGEVIDRPIEASSASLALREQADASARAFVRSRG